MHLCDDSESIWQSKPPGAEDLGTCTGHCRTGLSIDSLLTFTEVEFTPILSAVPHYYSAIAKGHGPRRGVCCRFSRVISMPKIISQYLIDVTGYARSHVDSVEINFVSRISDPRAHLPNVALYETVTFIRLISGSQEPS